MSAALVALACVIAVGWIFVNVRSERRERRARTETPLNEHLAWLNRLRDDERGPR